MRTRLASLIFLAAAGFVLHAADGKNAGVELFNGKDLTGWGYKAGAKFDGKTVRDVTFGGGYARLGAKFLF